MWGSKAAVNFTVPGFRARQLNYTLERGERATGRIMPGNQGGLDAVPSDRLGNNPGETGNLVASPGISFEPGWMGRNIDTMA